MSAAWMMQGAGSSFQLPVYSWSILQIKGFHNQIDRRSKNL